MKKSVLLFAFIIGFSSITFAQRSFRKNPKSPDQEAVKMTKLLQKKLNLSSDQTNQVNAVMYAQITRKDSLKNNLSTTNPKSNKLARREIMLTTESKLNTILTPDQMKMYEELKADRKEKMMAKRNASIKS